MYKMLQKPCHAGFDSAFYENKFERNVLREDLGMIILYHGSNQPVENPKILESKRALDFGAGFYLTSSINQAEKWAKSVTLRRGIGKPILNIFEFNENVNDLKVLKFEKANGDWLDYVVKNRNKMPLIENYDLIIGPVANDSTLPVINDYMDGKYTKEEAINHLLPQNMKDQFAFATEKALKYLKFTGVKEI